ncbi:hypothetical protein LCGC14_0017450 [marine sediment metagenome]|uniref:Uncharacterized protein n=1 Tax=marine sediment metagenome TaxID=412755 RepID=A0A0F9YGD6_9ZZZZ|nr:hypothetical protein [Phycisphaerae bacterium]HDZ42449.1 hypothetical protein [Phycisphaerae bacterium]
MTDKPPPTATAIISLLGETDNLLAADAWEPIEPQVTTSQDGDVLTCQAAPPEVADIDENPKASAGFQQTVELNQRVPRVVVASVQSRCEDLTSRRTFDYSLTLTLLDDNGKTIDQPFTAFSLPDGEWHAAEVRIVPTRPAKTVVVRLVCLAIAGQAQFRSPRLAQLPDDGQISLDGLALPAGAALTEGWYVAEAAEPTQLVPADKADCLNLTVAQTTQPRDADIHTEATLTDTTGDDRALTVIYVHPLADGDWRWLGDFRSDTATASPGEYLLTANIQAGRGRLSRWPLAAVATGDNGRAVSLDFTQPAVYRVGYSAGLNALYIAFDIALTPESPSATLAADVFGFDGTWGFRGAIQRMYELQPDAFADRTGGHGLWVPFFESTSIPDFEDFGFRFKEGIGGDLRWGNETGKLLTFHYIEPLTFWVAMDKDTPRDMDNAMAAIDKLKADGNHEAHCFETSVYHRASGRIAGIAVDAAWCDGIVWSMNSAPGIEQPNHYNTIINDEKIANWVENEDPLQNVSGWYIDSIEGYITEDLDHTRAHFAAMKTPLSYDTQTRRPVVFTGLVVYEFTRQLAEDLRSRGCMTMANTVPGRYCWLAPYLDVLGTETNWNHKGTWTPLTDAEMLYRRALTGDKPYCFLMNSDFKTFTYDMTERYMKRCVAYGMYPGYFSPNAFSDSYFGNPDWYERDRELFKKYVPLCKRVGEAGWQPITNAHSSDEKVYVERWGGDQLTVFNDAGETRQVTIALDGAWPGACTNVVTGEPVAVEDGELTLTLDSEDVAVLAFV